MSESDKNTGSVAYRTRQSLIWYTTVPFTIHFLRFANSILLARLLSPSDFGIIGIITVILYYCDSFSDFGFGKAIIQRKEITRDHYTSYFSFNILVSLLFFLSAQFFSGNISSFYEIPELSAAIQACAFLFLITAVTAGAKVKLKRNLNFKSLAIIDGLRVAVQMATSLTLALHGFGFWSIISAMLLSNIFALILLLYVAKYVPRFSFDLSPLKNLFNFGLWDFIGSQFKLIGDSADKLIIGKILGADALGYYDKALGLARMPNDQISIRLSHISFSSFARIQNDKDELENFFFKILILNATLLFPILVGLIWISQSFVLVLLGERWLALVPSLQIFAISFIFTSLSNPVVAMNQAISQVKYQTLIQIGLTIFLVVGLLIFSDLGIESAALMILAFNFLMFIASYTLLNSTLKFGWGKLLVNLLPPISIVLGMSLALYVLSMFSNLMNDLWYLLFSLIIGGVSYSFLFLVIPFKKLGFLRNRVLRRLGVKF